MNIPNYWLVISGIFFVVNTVYLAVLTALLLKVHKQMDSTKPQIDALVARADSISAKVESISSQVEDMSKTVNGTVKNVTVKTDALVASAESALHGLTNNLGKFAPAISAIMTGLRLWGAYQAARPKQPKIADESPKALKGKSKP